MSDEAADVYGIRGRVASSASGAQSTSSLIVAPVDTATPFSGTQLLEDGAQLVDAFNNRDWVSGGMAAFSSFADLASTLADPLGSAFSMGIGWVLDHVDPLKSWLEDLTGDAGEVAAAAGTWSNIAGHLETAGADLLSSLDSALAEQRSLAVDAYRRLQSAAAQHLSMSANLARAISTGLTVASTLVQIVHDLVRDALADVIGKASSSALEIAFTLGLASPHAIANVVTTVSKWANRLSGTVTKLVKSFDELSGLMTRAKNLVDKVASTFETIKKIPGRIADRSFSQDLKFAVDACFNPKHTDDMLDAGKSATRRIDDALSSGRFDSEFADLGLTRWSLEEFQAKTRLGVGDPGLSSADLEMLLLIRDDDMLKLKGGDIVSKVHLDQTASLPTYNTLGGFISRADDMAGLDARATFDSLRGDYYPSAEATEPLHFDSSKPLYQTRVMADEAMAEASKPAYSSEMRAHGAKSDIGRTRLDQNLGHTGPYTGHGYTASTTGTTVPESMLSRAYSREPKPVVYQETYNLQNGRRVSIVVSNPFTGNPIRIPTFGR